MTLDQDNPLATQRARSVSDGSEDHSTTSGAQDPLAHARGSIEAKAPRSKTRLALRLATYAAALAPAAFPVVDPGAWRASCGT